jgi:hypothetical protein
MERMSHWAPTFIRRADRPILSATSTVRVTTDAGPGYLKALGNAGGPPLLICDLVGTQAAGWLGLPTFDWAILEVVADDEISLATGQRADPGPAFVTREEPGWVWGGAEEELKLLINPEDIPKLVVLDTWIRNCDRYRADPPPPRINRNNVFFSTKRLRGGKARLVAMDHTHAFLEGREITRKLATIDVVKDPRIYGLFSEFSQMVRLHWQSAVSAAERLSRWSREDAEQIVDRIPRQWELTTEGKEALVEFLIQRADYTSTTICRTLCETLDFHPRQLP